MGAFRFAAVICALATACTTSEQICELCEPPPASYLFVADRGGNAIVRYDGVTGGFLDVFAEGDAGRVDRPSSVRLGSAGYLFMAGFGRGDVVRYDASSGVMMGTFFRDTTILEEPVELEFAGDELVVLGGDTRNVVVLDRSGVATRSFGGPDLRAAHDFVFMPDGTMLIGTDSHPYRGTSIQVWDFASGVELRAFGPYAELAGATGMALGPDGLLYVCDYERSQIVRFDPATGTFAGVLADASDGIDRPITLEHGLDGALYVLDAAGIHRMNPSTGEYLQTLVTVGDGHLVNPRSFTFITEASIVDGVARRQ
ncbi:MAG: hypothetical protein AB7O24_16995 [Kofleriaceae bacterium]